MSRHQREEAAKRALADIRWLLKSQVESPDSTYLDGKRIIKLLRNNFSKLDPDNNGISRDELMTALMHPKTFSSDEYEMLRLLAKYFDTVINLADDEPGEELKITRTDMQVLEQFLVYGQMTLAELHMWCSMSPEDERAIGPPPSSESS